jgi:hypothetical protein
MKKHLYLQSTFILTFFLLFSIVSKAQINQVGSMMAAGKADAQLLFESYLSPYINGFGAAMAGGWYNTAETHKPGGFDITFTVNAAMVPEKYTTMDLAALDLQSLHLNNPDENITPTVAGINEEGSQLNYTLAGYDLRAFNMPQGLDWRYVPAPTVQASVGLFKGFDLLGRYFPNIKKNDNSIGLWGLGVKHDIKQWIPGLNKLPVLQLSLMYGYTKLHTNVGISVEPDQIGARDNTTTISWDNQEMNFIAQSHTANLLVAAKLPVITFYGGAGFIKTQTNLKLKGYFPVADFVASATAGEMVVTDQSAADALDPIDMEIKNQDGGYTKPRLNIGFRLKLSIITFHFDYTRANFNVFTGGFGFSWR